MQCKKCKAEWTPPANVIIIKCPFCSEPIIEVVSVTEETELHHLLLSIVTQYEKKILGEIRLHALLSDLMPNIEKHHKSIIKQALQDKVGSKLLQLEQESEATRVIKIDTIKDSFKTNNAYNETADYIVDCFLFSLGWLSNIDEQQYKSKGTTDAKTILNSQVELAFIDEALSKLESAHLFTSGNQLGLSDNEIAEIINAKIKALKLKPSVTIDKLQSKKEIICSCDWNFELNQTKEQDIKYGSFTDERDGKQYKTVNIGNQVWMAENLAYTGIGKRLFDKNKWKDNIYNDAWCYKYNKDSILYQFEAAKNACPSGWHLPTGEEWNELVNYLIENGYSYNGIIGDNGIAKSLASTSGWNIANSMYNFQPGKVPLSNNKSGFSALPCGFRSGNHGIFYELGSSGYWWVDHTKGGIYDDNCRRLSYGSSSIHEVHKYRSSGLSVRCIMDHKSPKESNSKKVKKFQFFKRNH